MREFVEIQSWGFNTVIISSFFTMFLTLLQGYGFAQQSQRIWRERSVESISAPFFFMFFFYFVAFIFYGWHNRSLAMMFNGLLFIVCLPIVIGILKFGSRSFSDRMALHRNPNPGQGARNAQFDL